MRCAGVCVRGTGHLPPNPGSPVATAIATETAVTGGNKA
jgi:hypothetical protein